MKNYQGRAWIFGSNITTEDILPGKFLDRKNEEVGQFAMAGIDPDFVKNIESGDIIVGGSNFGTGSGRETAPISIKLAGISAVIAPSFSRLFFRNSINIGLPAVIIESVSDFKMGDMLEIDFESRVVSNKRNSNIYPFQNLNGTSLEILQAGGIIPFTKRRLQINEGGKI